MNIVEAAMNAKGMTKNKAVLAMILGIVIFTSTGLSGAYGQYQQPQQGNVGAQTHTHIGHHHRGTPMSTTGYNMTSFNHGNNQRWLSHNMTSSSQNNVQGGFPQGNTNYNMTSFNHDNNQRWVSHNMTGFNHDNNQSAFSQNMTRYNTTSSNISIPSWVKSTAKYWSQGQVNDTDFVGGLQYMIHTGVIQIPTTQVSSENTNHIPSWIKNNAKWWAIGQMSDADFVKSIQYLISAGIIKP
ncbi:hypothetical protein [Candidatus Nitrosotalea bavarica]|uniref:hypothetical protein n=1 Tax=Candidatus Nitrosotalea bavarica TaxID=1903277 RepID=UPI000C712BC2|nr:hypothetical protein [Candidatus Nitrosotalea bavarica]